MNRRVFIKTMGAGAANSCSAVAISNCPYRLLPYTTHQPSIKMPRTSPVRSNIVPCRESKKKLAPSAWGQVLSWIISIP